MANNPNDTRNQSTSSQGSSSSSHSESSRKPSSGSSSGSSSSSQSSGTGSSGSGNFSFRCKDAGHNECNWETRGHSEEEVLRNVEPHARQQHNIQNFDESTKNKVRSAIHRVAA